MQVLIIQCFYTIILSTSLTFQFSVLAATYTPTEITSTLKDLYTTFVWTSYNIDNQQELQLVYITCYGALYTSVSLAIDLHNPHCYIPGKNCFGMTSYTKCQKWGWNNNYVVPPVYLKINGIWDSTLSRQQCIFINKILSCTCQMSLHYYNLRDRQYFIQKQWKNKCTSKLNYRCIDTCQQNM